MIVPDVQRSDHSRDCLIAPTVSTSALISRRSVTAFSRSSTPVISSSFLVARSM